MRVSEDKDGCPWEGFGLLGQDISSLVIRGKAERYAAEREGLGLGCLGPNPGSAVDGCGFGPAIPAFSAGVCGCLLFRALF